VERVVEERGEPPASLVLALGVLHTEAFTWAVEKATELGATAVTPILAARVQRRRHEGRAARWQRVAEAAVAQCGRSRAPTVSPPRSLADLLAETRGARIVADPTAGSPPDLAHGGRLGMTVLVGPEGGFTTAEQNAIRNAGFGALSLGPRTLRAETAAVVALSLAQRLAGWL
jgi:16S rRNA (uracil1498-N3)-methyltransferase